MGSNRTWASGTKFHKRRLYSGDTGRDEVRPMGTLQDHGARTPATEFACRACGSPAVVYPARLSDDAPVRCRRCWTVLCTLREFRRTAEQGMAGI